MRLLQQSSYTFTISSERIETLLLALLGWKYKERKSERTFFPEEAPLKIKVLFIL